MGRSTLSSGLSVLAATVVLGFASPAPALAQLPRPEACAQCHGTLAEERLSAPARDYPSDIHAQTGFSCLACHGGASGRTASNGFLSKPTRRDIPDLCASCHADAAFMRGFNPSLRVDQLAEYVTSVHGQLLFSNNDPKVAVCTDCHPAHQIRPPNDPASSVFPLNVAETCARCHADADYMADHGIPTNQFEEYRGSVHGVLMFDENDQSAPTCNDCHGNHGAAPPGIESVRNVCGECHITMADFFAQSAHVPIFEQAGLPGCATCHNHHNIQRVSDQNLLDRSNDVCERCHAPGDEHGGEFRTIRQLLDSLSNAFQHSQDELDQAAQMGMEVSQAQFELEDVNNSMTVARTAIHTFAVEPVAENVEEGLALTETGLERAQAAFDEHTFRRVGLAFSTIIILALIAGIALKIRQLERRRVPSNGPPAGEDHA